MRHTFRSFAFALASLAIHAAVAQQPFTVIMNGVVPGCNANSYVNIVSLPGTVPAIDIDVPVLPPSCGFTVALPVNSMGGGFTVSTPCNGAMQSQVVQYQINPALGDTTFVTATLNCNSNAPDCLGVPGGSALPGTACTTVFNEPGFFDTNCACIPNTVTCLACFTTTQASSGGAPIPFVADLTSCSTSSGGTFVLSWDMPDGSGPTGENTTYTFPGPGTYLVCLWMTGNDNNCTNTFCDSIVVDANGMINGGAGNTTDCIGVVNGPNMPGTPCNDPATGVLGTWSADCECLPNVSLPCEAAFWVMQAYEIVPVGNDTTEVQPIPFELWIWNQSSGGTGNYQFSWDFGDGTVSTDAFPTHVYGASGPYEICLTMTDDAGCTDTFCDEVSVDQDGILGMITGGEVRSALTVKVIDSLPTSVSEQAGLEATNLWPNPVNEGFTLALNSSRSGTLTFDVVDLQGKVVRSQQFGVSTGSNRLTMDTHGMDAGLYMLRVSNGQHSTSLRFVKQ